tara:strand:+ start:1740 stop:2336 length:597 start_codon:yes stop_codon:yes gene_type:complete
VEIENLFPTAVGQLQKESCFSEKEKIFLQELKYIPNKSNQVSENNYLLDAPELSNLRQWIQEAVEEYFVKVYCPESEVSLRITQSWCNTTSKGKSHHEHTHPNSFVSGVFYIQTNADDRIQFFKSTYRMLEVQTKDYNAWNSQTWWLPVEEGALLLFPSSLQHSVPPVEGEKDRISLSFNTFPVGDLGRNVFLNELRV